MKPIVILGIFVADTSYRAERLPKMGETILGTSFVLGPGGKGQTNRLPPPWRGAAFTSSPGLAAMPLPISPAPPGAAPGCIQR